MTAEGAKGAANALQRAGAFWRGGQAKLTRAQWVVALAAAFLAPAFFSAIPAMVDYPNHLARMFLLTRFLRGGDHPYYEADWALYPNLAMDLLVPPLGLIVGAAAATKIFLLASQALVFAGAVLLEKTVKGRIELSPVAASLCFFSTPFSWGFLNFQFGLGVALLGLAGMIALDRRRLMKRLALHAGLTLLLFGAHLFALGIYGFALGLWELWGIGKDRCAPRVILYRLAVLAAPPAALAVMFLVSGGAVGGEGTAWLWKGKALWPFLFLNGYNAIAAALTAGVLFSFLYVAGRNGALTLFGAGPLMAAGFLCLYIVFPSRPVDTAYADVRLLPALLLIVPAFARISFRNALTRRCFALLFALTLAGNLATASLLQRDYQREYSSLAAALSSLEKGARLIVAHSRDGDDPPVRDLSQYPMYNAATLIVHYADGFTPPFFTARGKQPISAKAEVAVIDAPYSRPVPVKWLNSIDNGEPPPPPFAFAKNWRQSFDYVCLLGPARAQAAPRGLEPVAEGRRYTLYRIVKD